MKYFTADYHFNHLNKKGTGIIDYCQRPFSDINQMNEMIIQNHNDTVEKDTHEVFVLGDMGFNFPKLTSEILPRLKGRIHLILGNHDAKLKRYKKFMDQTGQKYLCSVQRYKEIKVDKKKVVLFHFPLLSWNAHYYGSYHLFGHCHGTMLDVPGNVQDVGIDAYARIKAGERGKYHSEYKGGKKEDYRPFRWDEIEGLISSKPPLETPFSRWQNYLEQNFDIEGIDET